MDKLNVDQEQNWVCDLPKTNPYAYYSDQNWVWAGSPISAIYIGFAESVQSEIRDSTVKHGYNGTARDRIFLRCRQVAFITGTWI